jgi:hypothetical protein
MRIQSIREPILNYRYVNTRREICVHFEKEITRSVIMGESALIFDEMRRQ